MKNLNQLLVLSSVAMVIVCASIQHFTAVEAMAQPAALKEVAIKPTSVEGGQPIEVIIRLTKKGSMWVKLNSSNNSIIPVQPNMPVQLKNVSSKSIHLDTNTITGSSQFVTISVSAGSVQRQASVSVTPQGALSGSTGGEYSVYKIKSNEMADLRRLAQTKGYHFDNQIEYSSAPFPDCSQTDTPTGIRLTATAGGAPGQAVDVICKFRLFGGQKTLNAGWTLYKLTWGNIKIPPRGGWSYRSRPNFGTNNPSFIVGLQSNFLGPSAFMELQEVWLKGPKGATWKDAFE